MEKFSKEDLERLTGLKLLDWQYELLNDVLMREYQKFENEILYGKSDDKEPVGLTTPEEHEKYLKFGGEIKIIDPDTGRNLVIGEKGFYWENIDGDKDGE